jgi:hypothetical protein
LAIIKRIIIDINEITTIKNLVETNIQTNKEILKEA